MLRIFLKIAFSLLLILVGTFFFYTPSKSEKSNLKEGLLVRTSNKEAIERLGEVKEIQDGLYRLIPYSNLQTTKEKLQKNPQIESVEKDEKLRIFTSPNDPQYGNQWALPKISAPSAWDHTTGSSSTVLAVIDTGVLWSHPDLDGKIWSNSDEIAANGIDDDSNGYVDDIRGWDFVNSDNNPNDDNGHGTLVAGIAAAETNNSQGIAGVDWQAKIMPLKAFNAEGESLTSLVISAIEYAKNNGATIINMSFGTYSLLSNLENALNSAYNSGLVLIAATGNDGLAQVAYPAAYSNVIAVGATDSNDARWTLSNYGPQLDVVAPGVSILSTYLGNSYAYGTGTSAAAPFVAGQAALILARTPSLPNVLVKDTIERNADKLSFMGGANRTDQYGYGRINLLKSLVDYHARWVSQSAYPVLSPGQSTTLSVTFLNDGRTTWLNSGNFPVNLGTSNPRDRISGFTGPSGWISGNRIRMDQGSVAPGAYATFTFIISVPLGTPCEVYREYFRPVADNINWLEDFGVYWDITVELPKGEWAGQSEYPTLSPGQSATYTFVFRNTGRTTWQNFGSAPLNLGTSHPQDRNSGFRGSFGWLSTNRIKMDQAEVAPGQLATFTFQVYVPPNWFSSNGHGVFKEYVQPVVENVNWLDDRGVHFLVTVP